jgi:hypothetical protein
MSTHFQSSHHGSSHFLSSHFGRTQIIEPPPEFTPEPVYPPGTTPTSIRQRRILEEDDLLLLVIQAWLHIKDE